MPDARAGFASCPGKQLWEGRGREAPAEWRGTPGSLCGGRTGKGRPDGEALPAVFARAAQTWSTPDLRSLARRGAHSAALRPGVCRRPVPVHPAFRPPAGVWREEPRGVHDSPEAPPEDEEGLDAHWPAPLGPLWSRYGGRAGRAGGFCPDFCRPSTWVVGGLPRPLRTPAAPCADPQSRRQGRTRGGGGHAASPALAPVPAHSYRACPGLSG